MLVELLQRSSIEVAPRLLGMKLTVRDARAVTSGYIVETESYSSEDPASHTFRGRSLRNASMFEPPGTIYVYLSYGLHYCLNIVCGNSDGQGVLIRALEPIEGIAHMQNRRRQTPLTNLANGPAKLTQALAVSRADDGSHLGDRIQLQTGITPLNITQAPRIGISKAVDAQRRYYITDNPFVSVR